MRYGKKLALCLTEENNSSKPFISHKLWREVLGRTVKEHRSGASNESLVMLDEEFVSLMRCDFDQINIYCRHVQIEILTDLETLICSSRKSGLLDNGPVSKIAAEIQRTLTDSEYTSLNTNCAASMRSLWSNLASIVTEICNSFNTIAWKWQQHLNYLDVNIAGFRKMIKQRSKQVPLEGPAMLFRDYTALAPPVLELQSRFNSIHDQLETCLKQFAPTAQLYMPKVGTETLEAEKKFVASEKATQAASADLLQLLLTLLPRE